MPMLPRPTTSTRLSAIFTPVPSCQRRGDCALPLPVRERAMSLSEPKASLGKWGEGLGPSEKARTLTYFKGTPLTSRIGCLGRPNSVDPRLHHAEIVIEQHK